MKQRFPKSFAAAVQHPVSIVHDWAYVWFSRFLDSRLQHSNSDYDASTIRLAVEDFIGHQIYSAIDDLGWTVYRVETSDEFLWLKAAITQVLWNRYPDEFFSSGNVAKIVSMVAADKSKQVREELAQWRK